jgi:transcriptional regulator
MHPNPNFRSKNLQQDIEFLHKRAFGTLILSKDDEILTSHVPFLLNETENHIELHLVRSNPMLKFLKEADGEPLKALVSVSGGDTYISPDWYQTSDQVPTWNYVAIEVHGTLQTLPQDEIYGVLERLSAHMEAQLLPKTPWTIEKMTPDVFEKMTRMIVPCKMDITDINSTWKLSQNKPDNVRMNAVEGLNSSSIGLEKDLIQDLMANIEADE